jgi:hypothetical protein
MMIPEMAQESVTAIMAGSIALFGAPVKRSSRRARPESQGAAQRRTIGIEPGCLEQPLKLRRRGAAAVQSAAAEASH